MFGHPSQHHHMVSGIKKALASPKTPAHLRPHLEKRMKKLNPKAGFNPKTAAKAQNSPRAIKSGPGGPAAQNQISAPPEPFRNPQGALNTPAPKGAMKGVGSGKSAITAGMVGAKQGLKGVPQTKANPFPKKRAHGAARSKFYGG